MCSDGRSMNVGVGQSKAESSTCHLRKVKQRVSHLSSVAYKAETVISHYLNKSVK